MARSLMMLFAGLSAVELGAPTPRRLSRELPSGIGGVTPVHGSFYSYTSFDQLSWMLVAYFVIRLLRSEDPRCWLAVGASSGLTRMPIFTDPISRETFLQHSRQWPAFAPGCAGRVVMDNSRW